MKDILLTDSDFIKNVSVVSDNLQDKFILSSIREAQDIHLQQILGSRLYNKLKLLVEDESILLDTYAVYRELLDNCQYYLAYVCLSMLCVNTTMKFNNSGVHTSSDDKNLTASFSDTIKLSEYYKNKADHYKLMLQNWLLKNRNRFPEIYRADISELPSNLYSASSSPIFLGGARGKHSFNPSALRNSGSSTSSSTPSVEIRLEAKELDINENGTYNITPSEGYDGLTHVEVNVQVPTPTPRLQDITITKNGVYMPTEGYDGFRKITAQVPINEPDAIIIQPGLKFSANETQMQELMPKIYIKNGSDLGDIFTDCGFETFTYDMTGKFLAPDAITTCNFMFQNCHSLRVVDTSTWALRNIINLAFPFFYCTALESINLSGFNGSPLTSIEGLTQWCSALKSLDMSTINCSRVEQMNQLCFACGSLETVNWSGCQFISVTNAANAFAGCDALTNIITDSRTILPDLETLDYSISNSTNLTVESLVNLLNALPTSTKNGTFVIGEHHLNRLSDTQKAIATNKNWILS